MSGAEGLTSQQQLERRREELSRHFAELQWDLGGAAYEMASREHYRLDVLNQLAARLQEADLEIADLDRARGLLEAGAQGSCPGCGAGHARGAFYCAGCGRQLIESSAERDAEAASEQAGAAR